MAARTWNALQSDAGIGSGWIRRRGVLIAGTAAALLAGCSANLADLSTSSVASYQQASFIAPSNGYSVSSNSDGSLHVTAAGPPGTPASRLEKIALARAAEYGDEQHVKAFKATAPQTSITCGKTTIVNKGERTNVRPIDYRVVAIDVTYEPNGQDAGGRQTRETANALKAELQSETVPPEVQAEAAQEVAQYCRR
jgi:hypothetical protein